MSADDGFAAGLIFGLVAGLVAGWAVVDIVVDIKNTEINQLREGAAKKGCAEYYLDEKHQSQWRWIK